jgi:hypothetical protein
MTYADQIAILNRAGLDPNEWQDHPQHGLIISLSGLKKIARFAPDKANAVRFVESAEEIVDQMGKEPFPGGRLP